MRYLVEGPGIVIGRKGTIGEVTWVHKNFFPIDTRQVAGPGRDRHPGRARGAARGRRGSGGRQRAGPRHPLRQSRPATLPAVGLRDLQGRARDRVAQLRRGPVARRSARRAHGDLRPHGARCGCRSPASRRKRSRTTTRSAKEIKLALPDARRRLGVFLRRRERATSEFRRRNIFELYIEEVVEACGRLKGGRLPKEKLKAQLQKIALKRTGGTRTDAILGRDSGPEGLPHSIIVTSDGTEGDAPELPGAEAAEITPAAEEPPPGKAPSAATRGKGKSARPAKTTRSAKASARKPKMTKHTAKASMRKKKR